MTITSGPDRLKNGLAGLILIFTFLVYNATKAPTLSFWDCGEFIACSHILGIPHPPGSPLYILIGRIFALIPFHVDISARINMFSTVTGAFAAMLAFLITFRLIRAWWSEEDFAGWKKAAAYIGAAVGSMMFAFGRTHWNNTMEAEVYTPAMLLLMIIFYLTLIWVNNRARQGSDNYLIAIAYLAFLSVGIHMTTFLFMPAFFLLVIFFSERFRKDFRFYITGFCLFLISYSIDYFLVATSLWLIVLLVATIITRNYLWRFSLVLLLAGIIGLSCQLYTPIRSARKPAINQNNPSSSYAAFKKFLERKQYGEKLMIVRALTRRAEWKSQLGTHERMGFWGFFYKQYGINYRPFALLFVLGLLGLFELARRRPKLGWSFFLMVFLGTLFLVWYMNFADGTRQDPLTGEGHIEVRDRDYFFTPGFVLFGIAIGLGVAGLMEMARESLIGGFKPLKTPLMILMSCLVFLGAIPVKANYFYCDRSRNYIPYDFAFNLLMSCEPNAILIIAGDNDTFPVWCLQQVYAVRPDVTTVNMSLANTHWYLKQVRDYKGIPLRWTDAQIDALRHRISPGGRKNLIQNQAFDEILNVNRWQRPIDFSLTVSDESQQYRGRSLGNNLVMRGLINRLCPGERPSSIDMKETHELFWNGYLYRSLDDSTIYKDERSLALTGNYASVMVIMADSLRRARKYDEAIAETKKALEIVPYEYATCDFFTQLYVETGNDSLIPAIIDRVPPERKARIYHVWASVSRYRGDREKAKQVLRMTLDSFPHYKEAYGEYSRLLFEDNELEQLYDVTRRWLSDNPDDERARMLMEELSKRMTVPPPAQPSLKDS
jgi:tetratricopeptide (TPR) repeat protein